jgi:hypothetical protein
MPQLSECCFDAVLVLDNRPVGPKLVSDFFLGDQFAGAVQQKEENLNRLALEPYFHALSAQLSRSAIEFERSKPNRI